MSAVPAQVSRPRASWLLAWLTAFSAWWGAGCATTSSHAPPDAPKAAPSKTVVFVHGMFVTPACWNLWQPYFESRGYRTLAPAWPAHDGPPAKARAAHPDPVLAAVSLQLAIWEEHARPESRRVGRDSTGKAGKIDFGKTRPPLLLIAGEYDHAVPPVIGRKTWCRYRKAQAITDYHEIAGADHWLIGSSKWQEVADYSLKWLADRGG